MSTRTVLSRAAGSDSATFTTRDGTKLRVQEDGRSDAPITVVFVHGWALARQVWDRVVAGLLTELGAPVRMVRFDLRGHGESEPAPDGSATIRQCADDLAELIADRVPDGRIVLAGHSMGGMTVMALAEQHPRLSRDRVAGVALVATSSGDLVEPDFRLPRPVAAVGNAMERRVRRLLSASRARVLTRHPRALSPGLRWLLFGSRPAAADLASTAEWVAACPPSNTAEYRWALAEHDRVRALEALRAIPTIVLVGLADRLTPYRHAVRIAEAVPAARLLVYAKAGHMLPLERDDEVIARIAELVRSVS